MILRLELETGEPQTEQEHGKAVYAAMVGLVEAGYEVNLTDTGIHVRQGYRRGSLTVLPGGKPA